MGNEVANHLEVSWFRRGRGVFSCSSV